MDAILYSNIFFTIENTSSIFYFAYANPIRFSHERNTSGASDLAKTKKEKNQNFRHLYFLTRIKEQR